MGQWINKYIHNLFTMMKLKTLGIIILFNVAGLFNLLGQNELNGLVTMYGYYDWPLSGVDVYLMDTDGNLLQSTISDENGLFAFYNLNQDTYRISASSDQEIPDVIDLLDVALMIDYLNGEAELDPMQQLVADVDGDEDILLADLEFFMENWYLYGEDFPVGNWVFEDKTVYLQGKDEVVVNGKALSDVDSDDNPDKKSNSFICNWNNNYFEIGNIYHLTLDIPFIQDISSLYLEIDVNQHKFELLQVNSNISGLSWYLEDSKIKLIWADITDIGNQNFNDFLEIKIRSNTSGTIDEKDFYIDNRSSILLSKDLFVKECELSIKVYKEEQNIGKNLLTIYPNPFLNSTVFSYYIQYDGVALLKIYDLNGKVRQIVDLGFQKCGEYQYNFDNYSLFSGIYIATLTVNDMMIESRKISIK